MSDSAALAPRRHRPTAVLGVLGAVVLHTGATLLGDTPDTHDSSSDIASFFRTHRNAITAGSIVMSVGFLGVIAMAHTIARRLEDEGARSTAGVLRSAATAAGTVYLLTLPLIHLTLSYVVAAEAPQHAKALFELSLVGTNVLAWPLAMVFAVSAAGIRSTHHRSASASVSALAAVLAAIAAVSVAHSGYFSPDVQQQVLVLATAAWVAVMGFTPRRRPGPTSAASLATFSPVHTAQPHDWSRS